MGKGGPWPLETRQHDLLRLLLAHKGSARACPISAITARLGTGERQVKAMIRVLILDFDIPIGASRGKRCGYFLCITEDDERAAVTPLLKELVSLIRRVYALGGEVEWSQLTGR